MCPPDLICQATPTGFFSLLWLRMLLLFFACVHEDVRPPAFILSHAHTPRPTTCLTTFYRQSTFVYCPHTHSTVMRFQRHHPSDNFGNNSDPFLYWYPLSLSRPSLGHQRTSAHPHTQPSPCFRLAYSPLPLSRFSPSPPAMWPLICRNSIKKHRPSRFRGADPPDRRHRHKQQNTWID